MMIREPGSLMAEPAAVARQSFREVGVGRGDEGPRVARPVFLVGSVRSGTTLLRLMLDHHPEVAFLHEFQFAVEPLVGDAWPAPGEYERFLRADRIFLESGLRVDPALNFPQLLNSFLAQKRDRDGKRLVGATVHNHFDRLPRVWPDARFIYLLRDGRDVGRSRVALGWSGNMYTAVQSWIDAEALWKSVRAGLTADRRIEVRYEALVSDPEATLAELCDFLGVAYSPAMLGYPEDTTYGPPDAALCGQWRSKLTRREVRLAEARIGGMLAERGYEPSQYPRLRVGRLGAWWLRQDDRFGRVSVRYHRYGARLFWGELLLRFTDPLFHALDRARSRTRERLHAVERATLK